jgi:D-alanyl-D-alanine carboxypeptidase/D-alanyl-D-alanine-endopeptidase (penicillin-binding protein 4)
LYEDVSNYYGAAPCALNYLDNKFTLCFNTAAAGSTASLVSVNPNYNNTPYSFTHSIIASGTRDEAYIYGDPNEFKRSVYGSLPANKKNYEVDGVLPDPALLCAQQFQSALNKKGIVLSGEAQAYYMQMPPLKRTLLYSQTSPSIAQLVQITNQYSNNLYCEALRFTLGKGDASKGIQEIKSYCAELQIDTAALLLEDACGLSRLNACSAGSQARFLSALKKQSKVFTPFYNSLSMSGKSGSLANFGKGTALENNLTGKSGFVTRARAYCGYLKTKSGKEIAFSVIVNNFTCSGKAMKPKLEHLILSLTEL